MMQHLRDKCKATDENVNLLKRKKYNTCTGNDGTVLLISYINFNMFLRKNN